MHYRSEQEEKYEHLEKGRGSNGRRYEGLYQVNDGPCDNTEYRKSEKEMLEFFVHG